MWTDLERARAYVRAMPPAVSGSHGHDATFAAAVVLVLGFELGEDAALEVLSAEFNSRCSPPWSEKELQHKVASAGVHGKPPPGKDVGWLKRVGELRHVAPQFSEGSPVAQTPVREDGRLPFSIEDLRKWFRPEWKVERQWFRDRSPVRRPGDLSAGEYLDAVFQPRERILVFTDFRSQGDFLWEARGRGGFRLADRPGIRAVPSPLPGGGAEGVWYLGQPVSGEWLEAPGTQRMSRRSGRNVTRWPHMVLESDEAPEELWFCLLAQLRLPIVAIYSSGGRSWHALVRVGCATKAEFDDFRGAWIAILSRMGADPGAITGVRLTRLPGCRRGGRLQELIYLDPSPDETGIAICEL